MKIKPPVVIHRTITRPLARGGELEATPDATPHTRDRFLQLGSRVRVGYRWEWKPQDAWLGVFWRTTNALGYGIRDIWITLPFLGGMPCAPLHITYVWIKRDRREAGSDFNQFARGA